MKSKLNQLKGIFFFVLLAAIIVSCNNSAEYKRIATLENQTDSLSKSIEVRDSLMNEMIETFFQIEKDLAFIKESQNIISVNSDNREIEQSQKDQIVQDVKNLAKLLQENKKSLAALNKKLKNSGIKIKNLETRVADLSKTIDDRNDEILSLKNELEEKDFEVSVLNEQLALLETEMEKQDLVISDQKSAIDKFNKAYYTLGTQKELLEKGVITKEGGFLGIGKTESLSTNINLEYFSEIDAREINNIEVQAEEAKLISEHPSSSYEFVTEENKIAYLAINDVEEFYKFSKFVVLEVK